jgi:hypothetical protein
MKKEEKEKKTSAVYNDHEKCWATQYVMASLFC